MKQGASKFIEALPGGEKREKKKNKNRRRCTSIYMPGNSQGVLDTSIAFGFSEGGNKTQVFGGAVVPHGDR